jgi:hypothetical protein
MKVENLLIKKAERFTIIKVDGFQHVITADFENRKLTNFKNPNYLDSGCALVGIISDGDTFHAFKKRWVKNQMKNPILLVDFIKEVVMSNRLRTILTAMINDFLFVREISSSYFAKLRGAGKLSINEFAELRGY